MNLQLGILIALLCAVAANLGSFLKHRGAADAVPVDVRRPLRTATSLWSQPAFALGMGFGVVAWVLHVAAITLAPLSVVQVVLAGGVVMIAVIAERLFGMTVGPRQWIGLTLTGVGLGLLAVTMPIQSSAHAAYSVVPMAAFEAGLLALGAALIAGPRAGAPVRHHGVMLAAASGILFGVCNIAVKALTGVIGIGGPAAAVLSPWLVVAAFASCAAFYASARALQDGEAIEVIAVTGAAANVSCIAGGIVVFGDPLPGSAIGILVQAVAFVMVIAAAALTPQPRSRAAGAVAATA